MKAGRKQEPSKGRGHVKMLGYRMVNGEERLERELNKRFGRSMQELTHVSDDEGGDGYTFYDRKNDDYDVAMFVTGAYDADIIRKACDWIDGHRGCFEDTILEVGCDVGAMTTFRGLAFPDKRILAIDRCANGVEVARRNCERFGVANVELRCCDVSDLAGMEFDTVFSMRTFHENDTSKGLKTGYVFEEYADAFADGFAGYSESISGLIKEGGNLVSIEKMQRDSILAGFLRAIGRSDLRPEMGTYEELRCSELGYSDSCLQAMSSRKVPSAGFDPEDCYMECFGRYTDLNKPMYRGFEARTMFWATGGELIKGFVGMIEGEIAYRYEARMHRYDKNCIVTYCYGEDILTGYHDVSQMNAILEDMARRKFEAQMMGFEEVLPVEELAHGGELAIGGIGDASENQIKEEVKR